MPNPILEGKKVAIVCDWLTGIGGAERVVLELHKMFPDAPIYTSQYSPDKIDWFKDADIRTGWLQKLPSRLKKFLPVLRAIYFSNLDLSEYDLIISECGAEAKSVKFGKNTVHISIVNAPIHYYWSRYNQYIKEPGFGALNWLARIGLKIFVGPMRRWDYWAAQRPTEIIAISTHIQHEIKKYYRRDSEVIFPPVNTKRFRNNKTETRSGLVVTGRQTPYKRIDLAVKACTKLNLPLKVLGDGPEHQRLKEIAGPTVDMIKSPSDEEVVNYLSRAGGFIFPGLDDFGISAVEALANGLPVLAFRGGGPLDYIFPGKNGDFFDEQTEKSITEALSMFNPKNYSTIEITKTAQEFSEEEFRKNILKFIESKI